jgi:hypothetical protein
MRKFTALLLTLSMIISMIPMTMIVPMMAVPVAANAIGTKLGDVLHTDIRVFINNVEIAGYNINGSTYVIAEDLRPYGFNVAWNGANRTLSITQGRASGSAKSVPRNANRVGSVAFPYVHTDIRAFINSRAVTSYNIQGSTVVLIDDIAKEYGSRTWDGTRRELRMTTSSMSAPPPPPSTTSNPDLFWNQETQRYESKTTQTATTTATTPPPPTITTRAPQESIALPSSDMKIKYIVMTIDDPIMIVSGVSREIEPGRSEITPVIVNARTLVPVRAVVQAMGGTYHQDNAGYIVVTYKQQRLEMWLDNRTIRVNGAEKEADVAPAVIKGTAMFSVRYLTESLGVEMDFITRTQQIIIDFSDEDDNVNVNTNSQPTTTQPPQNQNEQRQVEYYAAYPSVPDFGRFSGLPVEANWSSDTSFMYLTTDRTLFEGYIALLISEGFANTYNAPDGNFRTYEKNRVKVSVFIGTVSIIITIG